MLKNYIKIAFKVFLRRKFFTGISLFAIGFTLMVLMVATAFFDQIFGPFPPEKKLDRTLGIFFLRLKGPNSQSSSPPGYALLDASARNLPGVEKASFFTVPGIAYSYWKGEKIKSFLKRTDGEFWEILEFDFIEGGPYTRDDEHNANFVAVINQSTRKRFFNDESALGRDIEVDGQRFRVVGVVKDVSILRIVPFADIWVPISTSKTDAYRKQLGGGFWAMLLARSAADFSAIKEEYRSRLTQVEFPNPEEFNEATSGAETFFEFISRMASPDQTKNHPGMLLAVIVTLMVVFMILPTVNLVNLNVSRIMERASEIGVRKAFGASSLTLVGQFVVENVLLTLAGGVIGFIGTLLALAGLESSGLIPYAEFYLNYRIFLYGLALAVFFGLLSGVYPAWKMSRLHPVQALKGGSR
ncbi:MAG: ABC transporter permease [Blastocatellia bacterium]|nr:ABC transporter permease [Blastocatellia bacterium]